MATKDRTSLKNDFANGKYATGEKFADLIDSMKVVQLPVVDPQALGTSLSFIDSISQDEDGKITATKKTLDLSNAHELNPFKGWYKTGDTLPTDGFDGAYLYFKDTSELTGQTTIYRWNGTTYADTGTVVDTSNVQTFETGQAVNGVAIDETGLANPAPNAIPKATDVMPLAVKLEGVTASEEKAQTDNQISGYINGDGAPGTVPAGSTSTYVVIPLNNAKRVRLWGSTNSGTGTNYTSYAFWNSATYVDSDTVVEAHNWDVREGSVNYAKEYNLNVPEGATHIAVSLSPATNQPNFYCYLLHGENVSEMIPKIADNLLTEDATMVLSAKQGNEIFKNLSEIVPISFTDYTLISQYVDSNNTWSSISATKYGCYIIPLPIGVDNIYIKAKTNLPVQYAFLTSNSHVANAAIDTVEGDDGGRKYVAIGIEKSILVPDGSVYLYVAYSVQQSDITNGGRLPEEMKFISSYSKINQGKQETGSGVVYMEIVPPKLTQSIRTSDGKWIDSAGDAPLYHYQIPVCKGDVFRLIPTRIGNVRYAFLVEIGTTYPTFVPGTILQNISEKEPIDIVIPEGTKFLYIQAGSNAPDSIQVGFSPTIVRDWDAMMNKDTNLPMVAWPPVVDANGYDIVKSLQVLNALKKADQLRLVEFTPKYSIPAKTTNLSANVSRHSIPYSSNNNDMKLVGIQVSLHTFMTAINNRYSLMYTERCIKDNSKSAWNKVYDSENAWSYYGIVCCGLTSSVYGCEYKIHNGVIGIPSRDFGNYIPLAPAGEVDWNNLQVGDIGNRYESVHSFMIYRLKRDGNGAITNVDIIESSSTVAASATGNGSGGIRTQSYTKAQFESFMNGTHIHTLFRYAKAYKNTDYEQSPFVTLANYDEEAGTPFVYNNEICTFAGDKASFAKGDLVVLNYNLDDNHPATSIEVYKDDVLIDTKTVDEANASYSDYASLSANGFNVIDQTNHVLVLGTELLPGKYKACIDDSENYTYWEVLDTDVTIAKVDDDTFKIIFNGEPSVVYFPCFTDNGALKTYVLKEADERDKSNRWMIIHPKSQYTLSRYSTYSYEGKIRVAVKGDYGIATGAPVELEPIDG